MRDIDFILAKLTAISNRLGSASSGGATSGGIEIVSTLYDVITSGVGYSIGNTVEELKLVNTATAAVSFIYYNKTTNATITPTFSHLQLKDRFSTPSHIELLSSATATLPANTYKFVSLIVLEGSANLTVDGFTINNFPAVYTETWGNGVSILNKSITITTNLTSRVVINLIK